MLRLMPNLKKLDSATPTDEESAEAQSSDPVLQAFDKEVDAFINRNSSSTASSRTLSMKHADSEDMKTAEVATGGTTSFHDYDNVSLNRKSSNAFQAIKILIDDLSNEEIRSLRQLCDTILKR